MSRRAYRVLKLKNEDFSRDPNVVKALNDDPLTRNETQPAITVAALVRGNERLRKEFPLITLPVFILHGTTDKATKTAGSQLFSTAGSKDKTLKLYEGHYHDLLNDFGKETVMQDIQSWIGRHLFVRKIFIALLLAALVACGGRQPPGLVRLYVLDGGTLHVTDPSRFQLKKDEVAELNFSVVCRVDDRRKSSTRRLRPSSIGSGTDR